MDYFFLKAPSLLYHSYFLFFVKKLNNNFVLCNLRNISTYSIVGLLSFYKLLIIGVINKIKQVRAAEIDGVIINYGRKIDKR